MDRSLLTPLTQLAKEKFVLVTGPRQVGKTTLAKSWLNSRQGTYLNWDIPTDRERILTFFKKSIPSSFLVIDEIHKYTRWKSWLKGLWDKEGTQIQVIVTGSARLDLFQRGADSLLGRYELLRLHPFTIGELIHGTLAPPPQSGKDWLTLGKYEPNRLLWNQLERRSGFPEPFLKDEDRQHQRWTLRRRQLLIQEDIRELTDIRQLSLLEHLAILLPDRIGSLLSVNALREELQVAHGTLSSWLAVLERVYFCFQLSPYSKKIARSLMKEKKLYLWDWSQVPNPGSRFENMVAVHLMKAVHSWTDLGYGDFGLFYWRDRQKREVDFIITQNRKPVILIESTLSDETLSPHLRYLSRQLGEIPQIQLLEKPGIDYSKGLIRIVSADKFLPNLP